MKHPSCKEGPILPYVPLTSVKTVSDPLRSQSQTGVDLHAQHFFLCSVLKFGEFLHRVTFFSLNLIYFQVLFLVSVLVISLLSKISDLSTLLSFARNVHGANFLVLNRCVELHTLGQMVHLFCLSVPPHSFRLFWLQLSKQQS